MLILCSLVEGLSDLLEAETSSQRKQALRQMEGFLREKFEAWREELMGCLAYTEAVIDFGDDDREDDINDSTMVALVPKVERLQKELTYYLQDGRRGEIVRQGVRIALVGKPNAGKLMVPRSLDSCSPALLSIRKIFFAQCAREASCSYCKPDCWHHQVRKFLC